MPQIEEIRRPAQAAGWPQPRRGTSPLVFPQTSCNAPPAQEAPAPLGSVSKLTYTVTLGVSRATMYELIHREDFPTLKVGNRRLISRELLAEWVRRQAGG